MTDKKARIIYTKTDEAPALATYSLLPITCDEMYEKNVKYVENPNYKEGNGEVWVLTKYKNQNVMAHYCKDEKGNYVR